MSIQAIKADIIRGIEYLQEVPAEEVKNEWDKIDMGHIRSLYDEYTASVGISGELTAEAHTKELLRRFANTVLDMGRLQTGTIHHKLTTVRNKTNNADGKFMRATEGARLDTVLPLLVAMGGLHQHIATQLNSCSVMVRSANKAAFHPDSAAENLALLETCCAAGKDSAEQAIEAKAAAIEEAQKYHDWL